MKGQTDAAQQREKDIYAAKQRPRGPVWNSGMKKSRLVFIFVLCSITEILQSDASLQRPAFPSMRWRHS